MNPGNRYCEIWVFDNKTGESLYKAKCWDYKLAWLLAYTWSPSGEEPKRKSFSGQQVRHSIISASEVTLWQFSKISVAVLVWRV